MRPNVIKFVSCFDLGGKRLKNSTHFEILTPQIISGYCLKIIFYLAEEYGRWGAVKYYSQEGGFNTITGVLFVDNVQCMNTCYMVLTLKGSLKGIQATSVCTDS